MSGGRVLALACAAVVVLATRPAAACTLAQTGSFEVHGPFVAGAAIPFRASGSISYGSSFPRSPCAGLGSLSIRLTDVPPGEWGVMVSGPETEGPQVPRDPRRVERRTDGTSLVLMTIASSGGLFRAGGERHLAMQLVAADGTLSAPVDVVVHEPGAVLEHGWIALLASGVVALFLGFLLYIRRRQARAA